MVSAISGTQRQTSRDNRGGFGGDQEKTNITEGHVDADVTHRRFSFFCSNTIGRRVGTSCLAPLSRRLSFPDYRAPKQSKDSDSRRTGDWRGRVLSESHRYRVSNY
jgi:hypothetical protein